MPRIERADRVARVGDFEPPARVVAVLPALLEVFEAFAAFEAAIDDFEVFEAVAGFGGSARFDAFFATLADRSEALALGFAGFDRRDPPR